MTRDVTVDVHHLPDRSMRVVVAGPDGPVDVGGTRVTADIGQIARDGVRRVFGAAQPDVDLRVDQPPWLREGMIVRIAPTELDGTSQPYAQVVGFLPVGGVMVVHPESGAGVHAPEHLETVDPATVPPDVLGGIVRRTDLQPRQP